MVHGPVGWIRAESLSYNQEIPRHEMLLGTAGANNACGWPDARLHPPR